MTSKEQREKAIFDYFESKNLNFAGRKVTSVVGKDPPDILCTDDLGKRIGVELGEWVNADQIEASKRRETIEQSCRVRHKPEPGLRAVLLVAPALPYSILPGISADPGRARAGCRRTISTWI
jgi:hypothetical protein